MDLDCVVVGEICVDIPLLTVDRSIPLKDIEYAPIQQIRPSAGGIVPNCGTIMSRYGLNVSGFAYVGDDHWGQYLTTRCKQVGLNTDCLYMHPSSATSAAAIIVGDDGEHTFFYHAGASRQLDKTCILENLDIFRKTKFALIGYYGLMPDLEPDLAEVLEAIQLTGCKTALDTAGGGGAFEPLDRCLPFLDIYIPSYSEAFAQTGETDPNSMLLKYREYCPNALLGIKLGSRGALLSTHLGHRLEVPSILPPDPILDTTGAGDSFYAGLITGLCRGYDVETASRLAAASGACCITGIGPTAGIRSYPETLKLAKI